MLIVGKGVTVVLTWFNRATWTVNAVHLRLDSRRSPDFERSVLLIVGMPIRSNQRARVGIDGTRQQTKINRESWGSKQQANNSMSVAVVAVIVESKERLVMMMSDPNTIALRRQCRDLEVLAPDTDVVRVVDRKQLMPSFPNPATRLSSFGGRRTRNECCFLVSVNVGYPKCPLTRSKRWIEPQRRGEDI
jgi:hypothetical protein